MLEVRDLRVEYATPRGSVRAVDGVDLDVDEGEFVGVVGESGCGKSTMLFAIVRLLSPPAGITGGSVVTHDMSLVSHFSDQLLVMYAGQVVEVGPTRTVFDSPAHPYSRGLLDAFPSIRGPRVPLTGIPGSPPDLARPPTGCRFHPRCPVAEEECPANEPALYQVGSVQARCLLHAPDRAALRAAARAREEVAS